jgi:uncharacterized protein with von Willebrand factor type A (vWA) domain
LSGWRKELLLERCQDLFGMLFRLNLAEDLLNLALLIDQESHSMIAHVRATHEFLFAICAEALRNTPIGVGQQAKGQTEFIDELLVRFFAI